MNAAGIFALVLFSLYGLWLVIAPRSVVDSYSWIHKNRPFFRRPKPVVIRAVGICWIAVVLIIFAHSGQW